MVGPLERRRKGLLWMPLVAVPLLLVIFHLMGGGKGVAAVAAVKGLNMTLPAAQFAAKGQPQDKMGYYAKAAQDSARRMERLKLDPYAARDSVARGAVAGRQVVSGLSGLGATAADAQADGLLRRIGEMKTALAGQRREDWGGGFNRSAAGFAGQAGEDGRLMESGEWSRQPAFMRREEFGRGAQSSMPVLAPRVVASPPDPEMAQINGVLDKLIRVQHPEQVIKDSMVKEEAPVRVAAAASQAMDSGGFMEIGDGDTPDASDGGSREAAIRAVVNGDQVVVLGSGGGMTVELRLLEDVTVNGQVIPANELVYGRASVSAGRLAVNVMAIRVGQVIVPVALQAYDLDGQPGIRINGSIAGDVSKEWADETLNGLGIASVDPSLGAQAATAGLQLAKSLAGHKVRQVPVSLPAGYAVLLKNVKH